jgi:hypothetical protein
MALPGLIQKTGSSWIDTEDWVALPGLIQKAGWLFLD